MFSLNISKRGFIDKHKLLIRLGYIEKNQKITKSFGALLDAVIKLANVLIEPKQIVNISRIKHISDTELAFENSFTIASSKVAALMKDCAQAIFFLATIGPKLERKRDHLVALKETSQALLLDACGSEAVEALAETLNISLKKDYEKQGFELTKRYSPGYGDWELKSQQELLALLDSEKIGVKLTETHIMSPEKSVSAVIGLKKTAR